MVAPPSDPGAGSVVIAFAAIIAYHFGDSVRGVELGQVALALEARFAASETRARSAFVSAMTLGFLRDEQPLRLALFDDAWLAAIAAGDAPFEANALSGRVLARLVVGHPLDECADLAADAEEVARRAGQEETRRVSVLYLQMARALQERTRALGSLEDEGFDEAAFLTDAAAASSRIPLAVHGTVKTFALLVTGDLRGARAAADAASPVVESALPGTLTLIDFLTRYAHVLAASLLELPKDQRGATKNAAVELLRRLRRLTRDARASFEHRCVLVEAELLAAEGQTASALRAFERACREAARAGFAHDEALAAERTARFLLRVLPPHIDGSGSLAFDYLVRAHEAYARFGAYGKRAALEAEHPALRAGARPTPPHGQRVPQRHLGEPRPGDSGSMRTAPASAVGAEAPKTGGALLASGARQTATANILRAAQALSGELVIDVLLRQLMEVVLECGPPDHAALVLLHRNQGAPPSARGERDDDVAAAVAAATTLERPMNDRDEASLRLEAVARGTDIEVASRPLDADAPVALSVLFQAMRTLDTVVVDDASVDDELRMDPYVQEHRARSVLCALLVSKGRCLGALYLEHRGAPGVFNDACVDLLLVVCGQIAISVENARLYRDLKRASASLTSARGELEARVATRTAELEEAEARVLELERAQLDEAALEGYAADVQGALAAARAALLRAMGDDESPPIPARTHDALARMWQSARPTLPPDDQRAVAKRVERVTQRQDELEAVLRETMRAVDDALRIQR